MTRITRTGAVGWRRASRSYGSGNCVEAGNAPGGVLVRDTKDKGGGPVLLFAGAAWRVFVDGAKRDA